MKSIALLLLLIGIVLITIGYTKMKIKCPPPRIEYRFVPQTFLDQQLDSANISNALGSLFEGKDPWFGEDVTTTKSQALNSRENFFSKRYV
jgi:hypothetical protein